MERAAAVVVAGIGLVLLTLAALVYAGPDVVPRTGGVEVAAVVARPRQPVVGSATTATGGAAETSVAVPSTETSAVPSTQTSAVQSTGTSTVPSTVASAAVTAPGATPTDPGVPQALTALLAEISAGGIRFEVGGADLDEGARRLLDRVALLVADRDDILLVIRGHTDSTGGPEINDPLSVLRAQVVADHLVARGVPGGRIQVVGLGADAPVADNATVEGRRANRRTEITTVEQRG